MNMAYQIYTMNLALGKMNDSYDAIYFYVALILQWLNMYTYVFILHVHTSTGNGTQVGQGNGVNI